jgi:hypothetical protein
VTRIRVDVRAGVAKARQHAIEVGRLKTEVRHAKPGTKGSVTRFGRRRWGHPRRELADDQELSAEQHAVVLTTLARRDGPEALGTEARLVEPNRRPRVRGVKVDVVD